MIQIPVHNAHGEQVDSLDIDEQLLGGEIHPILLKQAIVRYQANQRRGSAKTRNRSELRGSGRKLFRQKGTGNARRGDRSANILRGGAHAHAKRPRSFHQRMPMKMRRLANRNALLAKALDGQIRVIDKFEFDRPNTKQFTQILECLKVDRSCLLALGSTSGNETISAQNIHQLSITQIDRLNALQLLSHWYLLTDQAALEGWLKRSHGPSDQANSGQEAA